jgi:hypothetical protein
MVIDQDVGGLDVTVNNAIEMGVFQCICDIRDPANHLVFGWPSVDEAVSKTPTLDVFTDDEAVLAVQANIVNRNDARVLQTSDSASLGLEVIGGFKTARFRQLDRNRPLKVAVIGSVDLGESTLCDQFIKPVTISQHPRGRLWTNRRFSILAEWVVVKWIVEPRRRLDQRDATFEFLNQVGVLPCQFSRRRILAAFMQLLPSEQ